MVYIYFGKFHHFFCTQSKFMEGGGGGPPRDSEPSLNRVNTKIVQIVKEMKVGTNVIDHIVNNFFNRDMPKCPVIAVVCSF